MFLLHNDLGLRFQGAGVSSISLPRSIALKITSVLYKKTLIYNYICIIICVHISSCELSLSLRETLKTALLFYLFG